LNRWCREIFAAPINFSGEFTDTILREARSCAHGRRFLSHGGDHYDHRTDFQSHDSAGTEHSRCQEHCDKSNYRGESLRIQSCQCKSSR